MRLLNRLICGFLMGLLLLPATSLAASVPGQAGDGGLEVEITVGYEGLMTYGKTMPIRIRLENKGADFEGRVCVNANASSRQYDRYELAFFLAAGAAREVVIPVTAWYRQDTYAVEVFRGEEKIYACDAVPSQGVVNPSAMLVGVLSDQPQNLSYLDVDSTNDVLMRSEYIKTVPLTAETFPDSLEMMDAFGMLAVDGFDISALSDAQQKALREWLDEGRLVLLGGGAGAATAWPAFQRLTGLTFSKAEMGEDPTGDMLAYLGLTGEAAGQPMMLARAEAASQGPKTVIQSGDTPILWRSPAGTMENSLIYTCAFSLSDGALLSWSGMPTFFQRLLIKDCYDLYYRCYSGETDENYRLYADSVPLPNDVPLVPAALAAGLMLGIGGIGAYLVLKRLDKRQLLWAVLPALAAAATLVVCLIGVGSRAARPTVTAINTLAQENGVTRRWAFLTAAMPQKGEMLLSAEEGVLMPNRPNYWYDGVENKAQPAQLRYRYLLGGERSVLGVSREAPWEVVNLTLKGLPLPEGELQASVWMEDDGLHGSIRNDTGMTLEPGVFACRYGYCSVPALGPGETYALSMKKSAFADPKNPVYEDGCMYESLAGEMFSAYEMVDEYYFKTSQRKPGESRPPRDAQLQIQADLLSSALSGTFSGYIWDSPRFYYAAFTQDLALPRMYMNDEEVERLGQYGVVCIALSLDQSANAAVIYRMPGMDNAMLCQVDENGAPFYDPEKANVALSGYYSMMDNPVFMFQVKEAAGAQIDKLILYTDYMSKMIQPYLYDGSAWVEYTMGKEASDPGRFVDSEGRIYIQFRQQGDADRYYDVAVPRLQLEGRVE